MMDLHDRERIASEVRTMTYVKCACAGRNASVTPALQDTSALSRDASHRAQAMRTLDPRAPGARRTGRAPNRNGKTRQGYVKGVRFIVALGFLSLPFVAARAQVPTVGIELKAGQSETITEGEAFTLTVTSSMSRGASLPLFVRHAYVGGFKPGRTYGDSNTRIFTILGGTTSREYEHISGKDDVDEPDGSITLYISKRASEYTIDPNKERITVQVLDDDPTTVSLAAPSGDVAEGETKTLTVSLPRALVEGESLTAPLTFGGTATLGTDYALSGMNPTPTGVSYNLTTGAVTFTGPSATEADLTISTLPDRVVEADKTVTVEVGSVTETGLSGGAKALAGTVSFSIEEATLPIISVTGGAAIAEGGTAEFTVAASPAPGTDVAVNLTVGENGSWLASGAGGSKSVTIAKGATQASLSVKTTDDKNDEAPGAVTAEVVADPGYIVADSPDNAASVGVGDDDATEVTLEVTDNTAVEGSLENEYANIRVALSRELEPGASVAVPLTFSGTTDKFLVPGSGTGNSGNAEWNAATTTVTFVGTDRNDSIEKTIWFSLLTDSDEIDDVVTVEIPASLTSTNLGGGAVGRRIGDGKIFVRDSDRKSVISIKGGDPITEGGSASFTLTADIPPVIRQMFIFVTVSQEGDFVPSGSLGLKRHLMTSSQTEISFTVPTANDDKDEANGSVKVEIYGDSSADYAVASDANVATVTVNDDDEGTGTPDTPDPPDTPATPAATFAKALAETSEGGGSITADISLSSAAASALTLNYAISGTAVHGKDYSISGLTGNSGTISVAKGSASASIPISITDDALAEDDETIILVLAAGSGYSVGARDSLTVTIADNEPVVQITAKSPSVVEGTSATFTISAGEPVATDLEVNIAVTQNGAFVVSEDLGEHTLLIKKGGESINFDCRTTDDEADEADGWMKIAIKDGAGYTLKSASASVAQVTVSDDDDPLPAVSISGGAAVTEGGDASFTVTATPAPAANLSVNVAVGQNGEFAAADQTGARTVTVGATGKASFAVSTADDDADEKNGAVTATLNAGDGYTVAKAPANKAQVAVNDNDDPLPAVSISGGAAVSEGGDASFTVTATPAPAANLSVSVTVEQTGDFAAAGATGEKTVAVDATGTGTLTVSTTDDDAIEKNGSVTATLKNGNGYTVADAPANKAQVAVNDNDDTTATPEVTLSATPNLVSEGASVTVMATLSQALGSAVAIPITITAVSAEPGDYQAVTSIEIAANQTLGEGVINTMQDDDEEDEMISVGIGSDLPASIQSGDPASVDLRIIDDDSRAALPEVTLSASPNPVGEGATVTITATLSEAISGGVTIPIKIKPGSAEADDFGRLVSIDILSNQTSGSGTISTSQDNDVEDETFTVELGSLGNTVQAGNPSSVELRITDDDSNVQTAAESGGIDGEEIPETFALEQNYPNPFNPSTTIEFSLDETQRITLVVYDMLGHEVRVLLDGVQPAARYSVPFDASDIASGTYLYVLRTEKERAAKTMTLLK